MYRTSITRWPESMARAFVATASLALLAACAGGASGPTITQQRGVDSFHSVDLRGAADISVLVGPATTVEVTSDEATLRNFDTSVLNGKLILDTRQRVFWFSHGGKVNVRITTPTLNALSINGTGNVTITGLNSSGVILMLQGAGNLEASGRTAALTANINGAGNMNLEHLVAGDATVVVNGAGNLSTNVTGSLQARVNGVGSITYAGTPQKLDTNVAGVGSISASAKPSENL
jgi:hypothetical protein